MGPLPNPKQEAFAQHVAKHDNYSRAYREVYNVGPESKPRWVWQQAFELMREMEVANRVDELRAANLAGTNLAIQAMFRDLYDIATADPREIAFTHITNCRHCNGLEFKFQWTTPEAFAAECERVARLNALEAQARKPQTPLPTCDGGFGFEAHGEVNPRCPECFGAGVATRIIADSSKLEGKARKLFKGLHPKTGLPEMHDQMQARDQLHRLMGAYKDAITGGGLGAAAQPSAPAVAGDSGKSYLAMVHGNKVA